MNTRDRIIVGVVLIGIAFVIFECGGFYGAKFKEQYEKTCCPCE